MNIGGRVEAHNSTFSEYGHVAYQIKGIDVYSNMDSNMCCHIQEFHKNHIILSLKLPPGRFKFIEVFELFKLKISQNWFYAIRRFKGLTPDLLNLLHAIDGQ